MKRCEYFANLAKHYKMVEVVEVEAGVKTSPSAPPTPPALTDHHRKHAFPAMTAENAATSMADQPLSLLVANIVDLFTPSSLVYLVSISPCQSWYVAILVEAILCAALESLGIKLTPEKYGECVGILVRLYVGTAFSSHGSSFNIFAEEEDVSDEQVRAQKQMGTNAFNVEIVDDKIVRKIKAFALLAKFIFM